MKQTLSVLLAALLACCSPFRGDTPAAVAPGSEAGPQDVAPPFNGNGDALMAALRPLTETRRSISTFATIAPRPAETLRSGQTTVVIQGHYGWQRTADDSFVVCVPRDGTAKVTAITSIGGFGAALNVRGLNNSTLLQSTVALPLNVRPCDALYVCSGTTEGISDRPVLGFATQATNVPVDEAVAVVFVEYDVEESRVGKLLRPPVWGTRGNVLVDFLRSFPWPVAGLQWDKLPSKPIVGATPELLAFCLAEHRYFSGDCYSEWGPHVHGVPVTAHQQYGTFVQGQMGQALLVACSSLPLESKKPLVLAIIQRAIDDLGGLCDGSWRYTLGGHCQGRRAPLVMLGHLYDIDIFADPTPVVGKRLPEDQYVTVVPWWDTTPNAVPSWTGYLYSTSNTNPTDPNLWHRHPSTWTGDRQVAYSGERWMVMYGGQVVPASAGSAAAILLMGRERSAPAFVNAVRCWAKGPPQSARADLAAAGCGDLNPTWGVNYANGTVDAMAEFVKADRK